MEPQPSEGGQTPFGLIYVTDEQGALIGPLLDVWRARRVSVAGRLGEQDLREVLNAIFYRIRTGCQ